MITMRLVSQEPKIQHRQANIQPSDVTLASTVVVVDW